MPDPKLNVTAAEAERDVRAFQKNNLNGRRLPTLLPSIAKLQEQKVHVFSVSPWQHKCDMGSWGSFIIPACPEGEEYVEFQMHGKDGKMTAVPGLMIQTYVDGNNQLQYHQEDGRDWAEKMIGNDQGVPRYASLNRYGVFVAKGAEPTKKELADARGELNAKLLQLVQEARDWSADPVLKRGINVAVHHTAARLLNLDEPWLVQAALKGRKKCPMCGAHSDPEVIKCGNCQDHIFDYEAYAKAQREQKIAMEAAQKAAR